MPTMYAKHVRIYILPHSMHTYNKNRIILYNVTQDKYDALASVNIHAIRFGGSGGDGGAAAAN